MLRPLMRCALVSTLKSAGLVLKTVSGGKTKFNRKLFNIQTNAGLVQGVALRFCTLVQRGDGCCYSMVANSDVVGTPPQQWDVLHPTLSLTGPKASVTRVL